MRTRTTTAAALIAAGLLALAGCSSDGAPLDQSAAVMCEKFVEKRLKSPGSADFSGVSDTKIKVVSDKKPWRYLVTGYVDSQNSFGGKVRSNYTCDISTKDDDTWDLADLELTER